MIRIVRQRPWLLPSVICLLVGIGAVASAAVLITPKCDDPTGFQAFLIRKKTLDCTEATIYNENLQSADPRKATLSGWITANNTGSWTKARYFNAGDLGFGREMNCTGSAAANKFACYVKNFGYLGNKDEPELTKQSLQRTHAGIGEFATVAMEYSFDAARENDVTFYAFDDKGKGVSQVKLDSEGVKSIPGACIICHGGKPTDRDRSIIKDSNFLPFDVSTFAFLDSTNKVVRPITRTVSAAGVVTITPNSTALNDTRVKAELDKIKALNRLVLAQNQLANRNQSSPISELIRGSYTNIATTARDEIFTFVPSAFSFAKSKYLGVAAPYCRGCHVATTAALDPLKDPATLTSTVTSHACGKAGFIMPQAQLTDRHLVGDVAKIRTILGLSACNPPQFVDPIPVDPKGSAFATALQTELSFQLGPQGGTVNTVASPASSTGNTIPGSERSVEIAGRGNNTVSVIQAPVGGGRLFFDWSVSSEPNFDFLKLSYLTASGASTEVARISGAVPFTTARFDIPATARWLVFSYTKDVSLSVGRDRGWVDNVQFFSDDPGVNRYSQVLDSNLGFQALLSGGITPPSSRTLKFVEQTAVTSVGKQALEVRGEGSNTGSAIEAKIRSAGVLTFDLRFDKQPGSNATVSVIAWKASSGSILTEASVATSGFQPVSVNVPAGFDRISIDFNQGTSLDVAYVDNVRFTP